MNSQFFIQKDSPIRHNGSFNTDGFISYYVDPATVSAIANSQTGAEVGRGAGDLLSSLGDGLKSIQKAGADVISTIGAKARAAAQAIVNDSTTAANLTAGVYEAGKANAHTGASSLSMADAFLQRQRNKTNEKPNNMPLILAGFAIVAVLGFLIIKNK
jgi:hypothetical protein